MCFPPDQNQNRSHTDLGQHVISSYPSITQAAFRDAQEVLLRSWEPNSALDQILPHGKNLATPIPSHRDELRLLEDLVAREEHELLLLGGPHFNAGDPRFAIPRKARRAGSSDQKTIKSNPKCTKPLKNVRNTLRYTVNSQNVNSQSGQLFCTTELKM